MTIHYHSQEEKDNYLFGWNPKMNDGKTVTISDISVSLTNLCYQVRYGYFESYFDESSLRLVEYDQF